MTDKPTPMSQDEIDNAFRKAGGTPKDPKPFDYIFGRPSEFKPEYCQQLLEYFTVPPYRELPETWYNPDGTVKRESVKLVANPPPHVGGFARKIGVAKSTIYDWARKYPNFAYSIAHAHDMRRAMIIDNALAGLYNPLFAKLAAANLFGWHDRQDVQHSGEVKSVMVRYHKPEREGKDKTGLLGGEEQEGRPDLKTLAITPSTVVQDPKGQG